MNVTLSTPPRTEAEFRAMPQMDLTRPENTCAMLLCGINLFLTDPEAGRRCLDLLRGPRPMTPYDVQFLRDRLRGKAYLPLAYFSGAAPANGYTPAVPYVLEVLPDTQPQNPGYRKVFLRTTGADSPRPVTLRQKGSTWCLWEYSSILSGIRIPAAEDPWA